GTESFACTCTFCRGARHQQCAFRERSALFAFIAARAAAGPDATHSPKAPVFDDRCMLAHQLLSHKVKAAMA
ncbi:MAG TPA: hypothetical protein VEP67_04600, partial [Thiobacillaceae bacterium]|nr:hypothetical protein [Thiobacillaceae bacterium]